MKRADSCKAHLCRTGFEAFGVKNDAKILRANLRKQGEIPRNQTQIQKVFLSFRRLASESRRIFCATLPQTLLFFYIRVCLRVWFCDATRTLQVLTSRCKCK